MAEPDVADLQRRLGVARQRYAEDQRKISGLMEQLVWHKSQHQTAQDLIASAVRILGGDAPIPGCDEGHELIRLVDEVMTIAGPRVHPGVAADRRLALLQKVSALWPASLSDIRASFEAVGSMVEWTRTLALVRNEIVDAESPLT